QSDVDRAPDAAARGLPAEDAAQPGLPRKARPPGGQLAQHDAAPAARTKEPARSGEVPDAEPVLRVHARHHVEGADARAPARDELGMRAARGCARPREPAARRRSALDAVATQAVPLRLDHAVPSAAGTGTGLSALPDGVAGRRERA